MTENHITAFGKEIKIYGDNHMNRPIPVLGKRIRNCNGAAGYIELITVFFALLVIFGTYITIARIAMVRMSIMDITRSELRVMEIMGKYTQDNLDNIRSKVRNLLGGAEVTVSVWHGDGDETEKIEAIPFEFQYREKITIEVVANSGLKLMGLDQKITSNLIEYKASYTGTSQRYWKQEGED